MSATLRRAWQVLPHRTDLAGLLHIHPRGDVALLDTPLPGGEHRWSFLCLDASHTITASGPRERDVFSDIETALSTHVDSLPPGPDTPPFAGGYAGWLGYELLHLLEDIPAVPAPPRDLPPLAAVSRFDTVVAVDHLRARTWVVCTGRETGGRSARRQAADLLERRLPTIRRYACAAPDTTPAPLLERLTGDEALAKNAELEPGPALDTFRQIIGLLDDFRVWFPVIEP